MLGSWWTKHHWKKGRLNCLRYGHRTNWFLVFKTISVFPVVIFRHISRDKGQKAHNIGNTRQSEKMGESRHPPEAQKTEVRVFVIKLFTLRAPRRGQARGERPRENQGKYWRPFYFPFVISRFCPIQILRKYPRRSCGSFWSGLERWGPMFDRFRDFVQFFLLFL